MKKNAQIQKKAQDPLCPKCSHAVQNPTSQLRADLMEDGEELAMQYKKGPVQRKEAIPPTVQRRLESAFNLGEYDEDAIQGMGMDDYDEEPMQGKGMDNYDEEPLQAMGLEDLEEETAQRRALDDYDEEPMQYKMEAAPNKTGLPDQLKTGVETLSGMSMDDVKVHYNSPKPAQLQALAYTQGSDIHVGPGQEQHLPHEAWHVVQQKQGRVKPTVEVAGQPVNDQTGLEKEADVMGSRAFQMKSKSPQPAVENPAKSKISTKESAQLKADHRTRSVVEVESVNSEATAVVAQLLANANVVVSGDESGIKVAGIKLAERVPTTAKKSQGDHSVAEVLIEESIKTLAGKTIPMFLKALSGMVDANLNGLEYARHTSQLGETYGINKSGLLADIVNLYKNLDKTHPVNFQYLLSELTTKYWRLLEKRDMTAFDREEKLTSGGGQEKDGMNGLRRAKERLNSTKGMDIDYNLDDALGDAIGYTPFLIDIIAHEFPDEGIKTIVERAARHVAEFFEVGNNEEFIEELTSQLGYGYQVLKGEEQSGFFGLKSSGNTSDMRY